MSVHEILSLFGRLAFFFRNEPYITEHHISFFQYATTQTCRAMAKIMSLRTVWVNALMKMCYNNCAIPHSFSMSKMSLLELEYAVMGPERWLATISKAHSQKLALLHPYQAHKSFRPSIYLSAHCTKIFLIPGGRYLLTLCGGLVAMWDLDVSGSSTKPLATVSGHCQYFTANPSSNGLGIRVCITRYMYGGESPTSSW